jgi:hypothetical protein
MAASRRSIISKAPVSGTPESSGTTVRGWPTDANRVQNIGFPDRRPEWNMLHSARLRALLFIKPLLSTMAPRGAFKKTGWDAAATFRGSEQ